MHSDIPVAIVVFWGGNGNVTGAVDRPEVPSWFVVRKHGAKVNWTVFIMERLADVGQNFEIYRLRYR